MHRLNLLVRGATAGGLAVAAAGCSDGQLVDAGGENGGGGLAFVLMFVFICIFMGVLFSLDRVRRRREEREDEDDRTGR